MYVEITNNAGTIRELLDNVAFTRGIVNRPNGNSTYLARAVSSVPEEQRERLEGIYGRLVGGLREAGVCTLLPVELKPGLKAQEINRRNDENLYRAHIVMPLMYGTSDGRSFEIGSVYGLKFLIPLVVRGQSINIPTLRRGLATPLIIEDMGEEEQRRLGGLVRRLNQAEFATGVCPEHKSAGLAVEQHGPQCTRCMAREYGFEVLDAEA